MSKTQLAEELPKEEKNNVIELIPDVHVDLVFRYDGHGISDLDDKRIATLSISRYAFDSGKISRNEMHDFIGELFASSPQMLNALRLAFKYAKKTLNSQSNEQSKKDMKYISAVLKEIDLLVIKYKNRPASSDKELS